MQDKPSDYLADTMPEEERLVNLRAISTGFHSALSFFLGRLSKYHELLELELEDSPGGERYLQEANISLGKALRSVAAFANATRYSDQEMEPFDLALVVKGMATRMARYGNTEFLLDLDGLHNQEAFIRGKLFLFQQVIFDLPRLLERRDDERTQLKTTLRIQRYDDTFFLNRKSSLGGGDYCTLTIALPETMPAQEELVHLNEYLVVNPLLDMSERLMFVYGVIMSHGGDLFTLKSTGGAPLSCLTVLLPAHRNKVEMYTEGEVEDSDLRGSETILLVDDEAIIWDVVIDMLQGMGYTAILAADGRDCVDIYRENPGEIDLVLLDMVMPEMNGKEAFFELKKLDPNVRVLLQSGYIEEDDARDVLDAGARGFLRKPYRMRELARRIREILGN